MSVPPAEPGMVVRYRYSWGDAQGRETPAVKDRPCVIIAAKGQGDQARAWLAPITHTPPETGTAAVALSARTRARLGLDDRPQWIVASQINVTRWPSRDLEPVRAGSPPVWSYGRLPDALGKELMRQVTRERGLGRLMQIRRQPRSRPERGQERDR